MKFLGIIFKKPKNEDYLIASVIFILIGFMSFFISIDPVSVVCVMTATLLCMVGVSPYDYPVKGTAILAVSAIVIGKMAQALTG